MSLENWKNGLYVYGFIPKKEHALQFAYEKLKHEGLVDYLTIEEFENNITVHDCELLSNRDILEQMWYLLKEDFKLSCDVETFRGVYDVILEHHPRVYLQEERVEIDHEGIHWKCGEKEGTTGYITTECKQSPYYYKRFQEMTKKKKKKWWQKLFKRS